VQFVQNAQSMIQVPDSTFDTSATLMTMHKDHNIDTPKGIRADVWLWAARFFKTRSLAKSAIEAGRVGVNNLACKPSRLLHVGDHVVLTIGVEQMEIDILGLSQSRGPAKLAQTLYRETDASLARRAQQREDRRLSGIDTSRPASRPDKRSRRLIHQFLAKISD
jgi:ribosome-associated heat shock protein Hsp15